MDRVLASSLKEALKSGNATKVLAERTVLNQHINSKQEGCIAKTHAMRQEGINAAQWATIKSHHKIAGRPKWMYSKRTRQNVGDPSATFHSTFRDEWWART